MKKILLSIFVLTQFLFADPPQWFLDFDWTEYEYSMALIVMLLDESGEIYDIENSDELRAISSVTGETCGAAHTVYYYDPPMYWIVVYSDNIEEVITFEYYDDSQNMYLDVPGELIFTETLPGESIGDEDNPIVFYLPITQPCEDDNDGIEDYFMGWDCGENIDFFGCNYYVGMGLYIYDYCPLSCGLCDDGYVQDVIMIVNIILGN